MNVNATRPRRSSPVYDIARCQTYSITHRSQDTTAGSGLSCRTRRLAACRPDNSPMLVPAHSLKRPRRVRAAPWAAAFVLNFLTAPPAAHGFLGILALPSSGAQLKVPIHV